MLAECIFYCFRWEEANKKKKCYSKNVVLYIVQPRNILNRVGLLPFSGS